MRNGFDEKASKYASKACAQVYSKNLLFKADFAITERLFVGQPPEE